MIYARHAEASVTVCLMHWSSLDPLLPTALPLAPHSRAHRSPPFFLLSFRGCPSTSAVPVPRFNPLVVIDRSESGAFSWKPTYAHVHVNRTRDEWSDEG